MQDGLSSGKGRIDSSYPTFATRTLVEENSISFQISTSTDHRLQLGFPINALDRAIRLACYCDDDIPQS